MKSGKRISLLILFLIFTVAAKGQSPVEKQAQAIQKMFANPAGCEKYFNKTFLTQVPPERLDYIFKYYYGQCGACTKIITVKKESDYSAKFQFLFEKNSTVDVDLVVENKEPYLISGLFFGNPVILASTFDDLIKEFKTLPGVSSLLAVKLTGDSFNTIAGYNPEKELAIGSSFKLYILSELLRTIKEGKRNWADVVQLKEECRSLPSGFLHSWQPGTNMTIESLASLMISISDNTATDNLLNIAGRVNVEKMLAVTGHSNPSLDIPFLATLDMFRLKGSPDKTLAERYLNASDKRKFIADVLGKIDREKVDTWTRPLLIDKIEWFASAKDLCSVMNWIRINSENEKGNHTRNILAINPGLGISKEKWSYIGYKGGSEPGVMNMTYLLRSSGGEWYALSCGWNNPNAPVDEGRFTGLVGRAIQLLEK